MRRFRLTVIIVLVLLGCARSGVAFERILKTPLQPLPDYEVKTVDFTVDWALATSQKGPACTNVNETTKKCQVPLLKFQHANWTTYIGEGDPHYIIIEQRHQHSVVAEWRYNIRSADAVAGAFDPDMIIYYNFLNKDGFRIGTFSFHSWRQCPPVVVHQKDYLIPGNLDFVADTYNVELVVNYRRTVKNC